MDIKAIAARSIKRVPVTTVDEERDESSVNERNEYRLVFPLTATASTLHPMLLEGAKLKSTQSKVFSTST